MRAAHFIRAGTINAHQSRIKQLQDHFMEQLGKAKEDQISELETRWELDSERRLQMELQSLKISMEQVH